MPLSRKWRQIASETAPRKGVSLRICQYNILADSLADGSSVDIDPVECVGRFRSPGSAGVHYYQEPLDKCHVFRTSQANLKWQLRLPVILKEISEHSPDIICLQEVDHFDDLIEFLQRFGYAGKFFKKRGRHVTDGCAIFWRTSALQLLLWKGVDLDVSIMTALFVRLVTLCGTPIVVCSTHLKAGFSTEMEDIRCKQAANLLKKLKGFAGSDAIILSADLNAHCCSYCNSTASLSCIPDSIVEPKVLPMLEANGFRSAYGSYPSFTTWGGWLDRDVKATLDYIMTSASISPLAALEIPADEVVADLPERLPNETCPSDHLCLVADVLLSSEST